MATILGISAFYHDSAACLVRDGEIVAAAQEERFTRVKHDHRFPTNAVGFCLSKAGIGIEDVDHVAFYDKPWIKFERLLETYLTFAPRGLRSFLMSMPLWLKEKLWMDDTIKKSLGFEGSVLYPEHHQSHAASAFFPSPYERAAVLTIDGVGEWATASWGVGRGNLIDLQFELRFPHSLGLLYSAFTYYTGFKVNSGEYKVMGLAPYGEPKYAQLILDHVMDLKEDGSLRMDMQYFNYCQGLTMTSRRFHDLFGGPPREPESQITQREMDLAASVQAVTEEAMLRMARHVRRETGERNLCLAGGVALNCVANGKILREGIFDDIWIQPAAGDAGGALGAAMFAWHQVLGGERMRERREEGEGARERREEGEPGVLDGGESEVLVAEKAVAVRDVQRGSYLGPAFDGEEVAAWLDRKGYPYRRPAASRGEAGGVLEPEPVLEEVAALLADGKVVGCFMGAMEFGPRALGARSIIGDARDPETQTVMNLKIKYRESFRPFAPSVLAEDVADFFELEESSPYMLLVAPVREERRLAQNGATDLFGIEKLKVPRSDIPAVTHVDYSARIQTVHRDTHPRYHALIDAFKRRTGYGVIVNTSFNVRGEPIVCTPEDAYRCFMRTEMDALLLEDCLLLKSDQPAWQEDGDWRKEFALD